MQAVTAIVLTWWGQMVEQEIQTLAGAAAMWYELWRWRPWKP